MANVDRPNGFTPAKSLLGAPWQSMIRKYPMGDASADTTGNHGDVYIGDPVKFSSGEILAANSGDTIVGVVVGVGDHGGVTHGATGPFNAPSLEQNYIKYSDTSATSAQDVWIVPVNGVLFEVQTASDLDLVPGSTADITNAANTAHGSRTTGKSTCELTTSSNVDVSVVEQVTTPDNDVTAANARHLVKFYRPQFAAPDDAEANP